MGFKEFFGKGLDKGVDCSDDIQTGEKNCRVMVRYKNQKLASGSEFSGALDNHCKFHRTGRYSVFNDDEEEVENAIKKIESECRGGIN